MNTEKSSKRVGEWIDEHPVIALLIVGPVVLILVAVYLWQQFWKRFWRFE